MEPTRLALGQAAYERTYGRMPKVEVFNRFFETNPSDLENQAALLTRPVTEALFAVGSGPIRKIFSVPGAFNGDAFVVSGGSLFRVDLETLATSQITGTINGDGEPEMCVAVGSGYEHLFIADGTLLNLYRGTSRATGTLTLTPNTPPDIATQTLQIGTTYYQWAATLTGSPDGSSGDPFQVLVGADDEESLENMLKAINSTGISGTDYSSTIVTPNTQVEATASSATTLDIRARDRGTGGNSIVTAVTGADLAWGGATLSGGGVDILNGVTIPDGSGASSVASLNQFVAVVTANSQKWYFIRPAEITIEALDFYNAADEPDEIVSVRQVGDVLVFFGQTSIERWYLTGDLTPTGDPFLPVGGQSYSIGCVPGTIVKVKDFVMFVGRDNILYMMSGAPEPITNHGFSEQVRRAREFERENP
jgi:hypothetical protein